MTNVSSIAALRSLVAARFPSAMRKHGSGVATGVPAIDEALGGGLPAGRLTELVSEVESGGSQLVLAQLLHSTRAGRQRVALVDASRSFDPESFAADDLKHLVWVLPETLDQTLAAADILARDGNYSVLVLDLRGMSERALKRTPATLWHRLHRAAESRPAAVLLQTDFALVPSVPWRLVLRTPLRLSSDPLEQTQLVQTLTVETLRGHFKEEELSA